MKTASSSYSSKYFYMCAHTIFVNRAQSEYKHSLTFCNQCYAVIAKKLMHRLQICSMVHKFN